MPDLVPVHLWNPSSIKRSLVGQVTTSPSTISGIVQAVKTDGGGLWRVDYSGISLRGPRALESWNAWTAHLAGGATLVNAPMAEIALAPYRNKPTRMRAPDADPDPNFPSQGPYGANRAIIATVAAAALRATTVTVTVTHGAPLRSGQGFGVIHASGTHRWYRIVRVQSRNGMAATVTIEPPLREAVTAGTPVDFEWGSFLARMIPDSDPYPEISVRHSTVSISFIEAFQ